MKILLLASEFPPRLGGIGTYAFELAQAAAKRGHTVTVVAADYGADQSLADRTLPFEIIRYRGGEHAMRHLPAKIALVRKLSRRRDFDVVQAADWPFYLPLALSRYRDGTRCLLTFHGTEIAFMQHRRRAVPLRLSRFWNGWAKPLANSRNTAERLSAAFGVDAASIRVTGLGVSRFWLEGGVVEHDPARFVIATLGRIVPRKGHLLLAEALALLPEAVQRAVTWQIIGPPVDPGYAAQLEEAVQTLRCETIVTGALDAEDVRAHLAASDLFCLPGAPSAEGAVEGYGLVYLEAAACGLPSVATRLGGIADAVADAETGLLVPPGDAAALSAAILRLHADSGERMRMAHNARARAERSGWGEIARLTYEIAAP